MCGINGIINLSHKSVDAASIQQMNDVIKHRGPDGEGVYVSGNIGLGHRRLSIIDVAHHSDQPLFSNDKNYAIVFNGEIYNYIEIKKELLAKGYVFRTKSDTEVLLNAYIEFGVDCVKHLNGMFAFSIHDKQKDTVFIARDRVGIKPLYYYYNDECFIFGSEIKSITTQSVFKKELKLEMVDVYLSSGYCYGENTLFKDINKVEPGGYVLIKNAKVTFCKYWDLNFEDELDIPEAQILDEIEEIILDATKIHLRSDVPLGVFLSGGVDSSAIVSLMDKLGVDNINTFSVGWDYGADFNESRYAKQIAKLYSTQHYEFEMTEDIFLDSIDSYMHHMDEPVTEAAAISLMKLSELTSQHVKVVLSGEGSDEVFGGYPIYKMFKYMEYYQKIPTSLRQNILNPLFSKTNRKVKKFINLSNNKLEDVYTGVSFGDYSDVRSLYTADYSHEYHYKNVINHYYSKVKSLDQQKKMQYIDFKTWLVDDLLIKADRMTMSKSLELRVPLLDHRLIDYLSRVPSHYRLKNNQTKYLFKKIMEKYLPDNIIYRKKMGFPTPLQRMFKNKLGKDVKEVLLDDQCINRNIYNKSALEELFKQHESGANDHHKLLWKLFIMEKWLLANS